MKKLMILAMSSVFATGAHAQSLEERVEALEYKGYENFFKMSGQMEMRFDVVTREHGKRYDQTTDLSDHATSVITQKTIAAAIRNGAGAAAATAYNNLANATDCGNTLTGAAVNSALGSTVLATDGTNDLAKNGCTTYKDGQKDGNSFNRMFVNLDMESNPTNKMTFYGRLTAAKFMGLASQSGTAPNSADPFYDFRAGQIPVDSQLWLERAFVNYNIGESGVFSFGRLPTIEGAPTNLRTNQPWQGNYPLAAYSGIFDGVAYTHGFEGGHSVRFVYSPFALINFDDQIAGDANENDRSDVWTFMYEIDKRVSFARRFHAVLMHSSIYNLGLSGSELLLNLDRTSFYAEFLGIADTGWDFAFSYQTSKTASENNLGNNGNCFGGWVSGECGDSTATGAGYGFILRYGFSSKIKAGVEYYANDKDTFAVDIANNEIATFFANYGSGTRIFYVHDLSGGLKVQTEYTMMQTDYVRGTALVGEATEVDIQTNVATLRLISNF